MNLWKKNFLPELPIKQQTKYLTNPEILTVMHIIPLIPWPAASINPHLLIDGAKNGYTLVF
jgi:hypothetical protein